MLFYPRPNMNHPSTPVAKLRRAAACLAVACLSAFTVTSMQATARLEPAGKIFGCYVGYENGDSASALNSRLGFNVGALNHFTGFPVTTGSLDYYFNEAAPTGSIVIITTMPSSLATITQAQCDDFADLCAAYEAQGLKIMIRFAHEMNGGWFSYGQQPSAYVAAFRMLADAIHTRTTQTAMIWCPNVDAQATLTNDTYSPYYPGDAYVDWVGLDLYHQSPNSLAWDNRTVNEFTKPMAVFHQLYALNRNKPLGLFETAAEFALEIAGPAELAVKQSWWSQALASQFSKLKLLAWFDVTKSESGYTMDWRISADPAVRDAFVLALVDNGWATPNTPPWTPAAPAALTATALSSTRFSLNWTDLSGIEGGFKIERSADNVTFTQIATVPANTTTFTDGDLTPWTTRYYRVRACNTGGNSAYTASVAATSPGGVATVKDNADTTGITLTGSWTASTSEPNYQATNYLSDGNTGATGGKSVRFTPTLADAGTYDVYLRWPAGGNRSTNTPVVINHAAGTANLTINQKIDGGRWVFIGSHAFNAGAAGSVLVKNDGANGHVIADAVKFVSGFDLIKDNASASGVTVTGAWTASTYTAGYYADDYLHDDNDGKGSKSVRFTPQIPHDGPATVYVRWTAAANRATNVPIDITHATGTTTVTVNQQTNGGVWYPLGTYSFNAGTGGNILIRTTGTTGYVIVDAVRIVR